MMLKTIYMFLVGAVIMGGLVSTSMAQSKFDGKHYRGEGDVDYIRLLDISRRMFEPDPEFMNLSMLYTPAWNGLVEGPTWDAWWIQNSYGTTYCALPFYPEPFVTWLQNSQDLWFDQMGDGKRKGADPPFDWIAPDGCLCDAARPGWIVYKQGDGNTAIHDWAMEFTAAGILLQSELLLIGHDTGAANRYLPKLERCAEFIESRRDPKNNLFLAGPAGNLLAPSFAGWKKPDGTYGKAYLTGLSVTYIAALDRLVEVEKLAGRKDMADRYARQRASAKRGLALLTTPDGYLIRSLDPDGVKHGVFGAKEHGYFETSPNQDAVCFRVADDKQANRIYDKIASIKGLRPYDFIIPNYPSYDDMYAKPEGLWAFGTWVNGGHWSTCEARMIMAYCRLSKFEDVRRSLKQLLTFANKFRMDNPLVKFGSEVYQPGQPINCTYDAFGPPAAMLRGLFEYLYTADRLTLVPHIPAAITRLEQRAPVRFGKKLLFLSVYGKGVVTSVLVNGRMWKRFSKSAITLPYSQLPNMANVEIALGGYKIASQAMEPHIEEMGTLEYNGTNSSLLQLVANATKLKSFIDKCVTEGLGDMEELAHARMALSAVNVAVKRAALEKTGTLPILPDASMKAADQLYVDTANKLADGLASVLLKYEKSEIMNRAKLARIWNAIR